jgi:acyl transferase domain-containing protein/NAD(P)-dependent dehydrogenase (short-subunit alcohol dehydrogenase family)/acyl carrier protein
MAAELLEESPLFAEQIESCEAALAPYMEPPLTELLRSSDEQWLSRVELVQPALFAVMVALAELWRSHGVEPAAVIGHSQGEVAAAVVAGALSLEDGAKLADLRAKSLMGLMGKGEMASVQASAEEVEPHLAPYADRVSIAAHNGPRATVISGEPQAISELIKHFEAQGTRARLIPVGYASHCAQVEAIEEELKEAIADISAKDSAIPFYSTLSGEPIQTSFLDADYWYRNLREPVCFRQATERLLKDGHSAFVEVSAHPVLALALSETAEAQGKDQTAILHTLRREEGGSQRMFSSLAAAHAHGVPVDFAPLFEGTGAQVTELPTYPFQRQRYWLEASRGSGDASSLGQSSTEHPLLGASVPLADGSQLLTGRISQATHPWLAEHAIAGTAILPGTAFVELALRAGQEVGATYLAELILEAPLPIPEEGAVQLQVTVSQDEDAGEHRVEIHARPEPTADQDEEVSWSRHASATLTHESPTPLDFDATQWPPAGAEPLDTADLYERVADLGLEYGPAFQGFEAAWKLGEEIYAEVSLAEEQEGEAARFGLHPALLDAALHAAFLEADPSQGVRLPFSFSGVSFNGAEGPITLRVRLRVAGEKLRLEAADAEGKLAARVEALATRELDPTQLGSSAPQADALFGIEWSELELPQGEDGEAVQVRVHRLATDPGLDPTRAAHQICAETLGLLQEEIAGEDTSRLALLTQGAMALDSSESPDPALTSVWGLVRSAQSEHPGRFVLIDTDGTDASERALAAALRIAGEPQLALREGVPRVPRLVRAAEAEELVPPARPWRLAAGHGDTIESLEAVAAAEAMRPLGADEVRVEVHAAGLNFRDVLIALGMYPAPGTVGGEGAGVVLEVGSGVDDLRPGDRVFGLLQDAFGPVAVAGRGMLAHLPDTWSFTEGAAVPIVACTAYYGLRDLANLQAGERVLVHAGAGGVGTVAIGIAQHLGAEVFATASPGKWEALRRLGLDDDHIASSRDLDFKDKFLEVTGGQGMDVVLDSLAKEFVDASLDLLPRGGRFLEMGKTDVRDPERVAAEHPGVLYRDYDLFEAGTERLQTMLAELLDLYGRGAIRHAPIAAWDVRDAKGAFRHLSQARHVGKLVLRIPREPDPEGTVLVTGGLSGIGALTARNLAEQGAKHLLLTSRRGPEAPGAAQLIAELAELGCEATAVACDVSDRAQVEALVASVPAEHPLTAVIHSAGVLDDGVIESLDASRLATVLAPKADAAWHLHEATRDLDLAAFVLYSSAAATFGSPGQGNYAAANSFLDGLAARRRAEGLPATSIAWGLWEQETEATGHLGDDDRARLQRVGISLLGTAAGLELFDRACHRAAPLAVATPLQPGALRAAVGAGLLPPLFSGLVGGRRRRAGGASGSLAQRLEGVAAAEREGVVLALVREHAAVVLGHASAEAIDPAASFKDLGFDSLGAVELRNRLGDATGARLDATLVFDYPTPAAVAGHLLSQVERTGGAEVVVHAARGSDEPIAIVGMSCRFPGEASSPQQLWEMLASGGDGIVPFPTDRGWDLDGLYDADPDRAGRAYVREGGFLRETTEFDPGFFGISPREALAMDPQQRLLLEAAWEALEDAGIDPAELRGSDTGVFAGAIASDYLSAAGRDTAADLEGHALTGVPTSVASGRVAYALGLEGPAMTIDTACSSSLVAMHLAAQALRAGECELALAGGVTTMATPGLFISTSRQRALSVAGRCKSFSAEADGAGFSEGSGLLLLERLSDAKAKGRRILAVIKGSATNQDGASNGLTAPNGPSQERVIRQALANAGLKPSEVDVVEAHGTGTALGDPIEAGALLATYGQERETPLQLGSLKSNIGHTQAAAGVGGVIKMVMALREEALPKTLHVTEPTPHVDWSAGEIELLTEARPWLRGDRPRRAGISSFGISGTNAHLILEEAPEQPVAEKTREAPPLLPFALSAKTPEALADAAGRLAAHLETKGPDSLDVAHTLLNARAQLEQRAVIVAADEAELLHGLDALAQGKPAENLTTAKASAHTKAVFCFPGQGSQWLGMASELLDESPLFAEQIERCEAALAPYIDTPLTELLRSEDEGWLSQVELVQPPLFAVMVALAELWRSYGVEPAAVIGHSQGEVAAAVIAGALSLEDGARLAALRAKPLMSLMGKGETVSVQASAEEVELHLKPYAERVSIAAYNGARATVLSGEPEAIEELIEHFEAEGTRARLVPIGLAAHCAQIDAVEGELKEAIGTIEAQDSAIPFYSTLTGEPLDTSELDAGYWHRNIREPVRFRQATERLLQDGHSAFVEVSAHPALALALSETAEAQGKDQTAILHTLRREEGNSRRMLSSLAAAHAHGVSVDFSPLFEGTGAQVTELPTYPFQRQRYWLEASRGSGDASSLGQASTEHPLLGASVPLADGSHLLTGRISQGTHPWLAEHAVAGTAILPGTAFVELALRAGQEVGATHLSELILVAPLPVPEEGAVQLQVTVSQDEDAEEHRVEIHARPEPTADQDEEVSWSRHASATLSDEAPLALDFDATAWPPAGAEPLASEDLYERVADLGLEYGPAFQGLEAAWRLGEEIYAEVSLAEEQSSEAGSYGVHPALLDAALHPAFLDAETDAVRLPFSFNGVALHAPEGPTALRVRLAPKGEKLSLQAADDEGNPVLGVESLATREVDPAQLGASAPQADALFDIEWTELELPEGGEEAEEVRVHRLAPDPGLDPAEAAHKICAEALGLLQKAIAGEDTSRLALLTQGAMALDTPESPDPALASVWGLVRSAQSEHPGRFVLVDTDGSEASEKALTSALAQTGEPQLALREGVARVPRLVRMEAQHSAPGAGGEPAAPGLDPEGTVLITGGLSGLGALTATHLAERGAKHLLLTSRRGPGAPGAAELIAELAELGCEAEAVACDVADSAAVETLVLGVSKDHPLTAIVHSAGALDDATIESLDAARLDAVLAPKADAAWSLHEATRGLDLAAFVLYSSAAATFGSPGQGNYAAANGFLDALAQRRGAEGLAATAIAWGPWEGTSELITDAERERLARSGLELISVGRGLELLDRTLALPMPFAVATPLRRGPLRSAAEAGVLPPLLSGLVGQANRRPRAGAGAFARHLASVPAAEREAAVLGLVCEQIATVLGHASPESVDPTVPFKDLGFDSLGAVELRNRLSQASGVRLEATLVFDYPTPAAVSGYLLERMAGTPVGPSPVQREFDRLELALAAVEGAERDQAAARLRLLNDRIEELLGGGDPAAANGGAAAADIARASDDELFELIDKQLGAEPADLSLSGEGE